jgi:hypothetical protein
MPDEPSSDQVWGGSRRTLVAAGALIVALLAAVVWLVATGGSNSAAPPKTNPKSAAAAADRPCPLAFKVSTDIPSATAPPTTWVNVRGFEVPTGTDGPLYRDGDRWTCFAHTPMGALLTAMASAVPTFYGDRAAYASFFPPGHWSDAQLATNVPSGGQVPTPGVQIVGYEFGPWTVNGGTLYLVDSCNNSQCQAPYYSIGVELKWTGSQWYLVGDSFEVGTGTPLNSLVGVTPWEAP